MVVTTHYLTTFELLEIDRNACLEMPQLEKEDATNLFLHYVVGGKQFVEDEDKHAIKLCLARCHFDKGGGKDLHYHPLALEVLHRQVDCFGKKSSKWLSKIDNIRIFFNENLVFDVFRNSFDQLPQSE